VLTFHDDTVPPDSELQRLQRPLLPDVFENPVGHVADGKIGYCLSMINCIERSRNEGSETPVTTLRLRSVRLRYAPPHSTSTAGLTILIQPKKIIYTNIFILPLNGRKLAQIKHALFLIAQHVVINLSSNGLPWAEKAYLCP
jgi:hypothetical protein